MALQLYTLVTCYVDGAMLAEEARVTIDRETNAQNVLTVAKGFAGLSPGAAMMMITIESAIPAAAFELNPGFKMKNLVVTEFTFAAAGSVLTTKGFIVSDNLAHAVNSESKLDMKIVAEMADWKSLTGP